MTEADTAENQTKRILFVCRKHLSHPMAEAICNALAEDRNLPLRVASAEVAALAGEDMAPNSRAALE